MNIIDNLKGKTILFGKEPVNGRLFVSVKINGQPKTTVIGEMNSVPNSVSRCKPAENTAHCKIEVDATGNLVVTNLKPQNVTYVNGAEIVSKKVKSNGMIELGKDRYSVSVNTIIETASKIVATVIPTPPSPPEEYSIKHLKKVWDDYNARMRDIKIRTRNIGILSSIPMAFSMLGGLIAGVAPEIREFALVLTGIALFIMLIGFYKKFTDKSIEETEQITEEFQRKYVCPNKKKPCNHFLGNVPYNILRQNTKCPYCGCGFNEKLQSINMAKELLPNSVLQNGKYKIVKVLGGGTFGFTYKALAYVHDSGISGHIQVAVKEFFIRELSDRADDGNIIVNSESSIVRNYMLKFKNQADRLSSLAHENINKVLDAFYENNTYYVVYEFIDGLSVDDYIKSEKCLSESESLSIVKEVGSALSYLHNRNIVHLDVKPGNMMISKDYHVYLIDYGLSKQYNKDGNAETSTNWGIGTLGYSPLDRQSNIGGKIPLTFDIYGLAASLYKMLTGQRPPDAADVLNEGFPTERLLQSGVSSNTISCIEKAMSPMRKARYQTIEDFLDALNISVKNDVQEDTEYAEYDDDIIVEKVDKTQALPVGTKLHGNSYDYEIKDVLGQESYGITYLADLIVKGALGSLGSNLHVAIKEFFMRDVNGRQNTSVTAGSRDGLYGKYKEKFISESLRLSELKHNGIVKVLEAFEDNNTCYYAMEFIEGMSLDEYIKKSGGIDLREAISITKEIGDALSYMHSHKMLHLDLKPQNIMRRSNGHILLIDFGLAKQYDENGKPETSTSVGGGTRGYAPIEQANYHDGKGFPVTMDVYALAASLYKMLTCLPPQDASDVLNDGLDVSPLRKRMLGEDVINLIEVGMSPMKRNRPQTVSEFISMLRRLDLSKSGCYHEFGKWKRDMET